MTEIPGAVGGTGEEEEEVLLVSSQTENAEGGNSIRRKSFSNPENIENFDKAGNVRLEEHIKLQHLQQLMDEFSQHKPQDILLKEGSGYFPPKVLKRIPGCMNLEEFKSTISKVLGTNEYDEYLEKLFMKLDTSCDGYVDWHEFCTYLLLLYRENDYLSTKRDIPFMLEPRIRHIVHNRQEETTKIVAVNSPTRFITISKEGIMSVWQPNMAFEKHYVIADDTEDQSPQKRRFKMWVTDAIYMTNCQKVAIGSTSRDIRFYDVSSPNYFEEYHLFAMNDVPYCFDYHYNKNAPNTASQLIFGVDTGAIHILKFLKPVTQLFQNPFKSEGGVQKVFMQDIPNHSMWVDHTVLPDVHTEIIKQVRYLPENNAIISSCSSPKNTIIITDVLGVKKSYVFRIEKGIECFDHNKNMNLLVSGSGDHYVRLWNPYVPNKAVAILIGHATGIVGVAIYEPLGQIFSYSKDAVVKVWDTKENICLQTVVLKFTSSIHGHMPEHGQFPLYLQVSPHSTLLVTCNDYIASLRLGKVEEKQERFVLTHDTQLCCAIYNNLLKQVATGCDSSTIGVWDIESGSKSIVFSNAHGEEEITCMAFDSTDRRLITGARNGTVKVWNFQNGHNLHKLEAVGEAEVTGIIQLPDKKAILTVGWNQLISTYDDTDADNMYLSANTSWKGGQLHKDDILTADFCPPNIVATGGFDGEIIVWDADTEKVYMRLRKGQPPNISKKLQALKTKSGLVNGVENMNLSTHSRPSSQGLNSRPNSRHRSSHKPPKGQTAPVDKLLFLKARASIRFTESAVLLSSDGGILRWWNYYSSRKELGNFYAPLSADESLLAMCTKPNDSLLVTGDTQGNIRCWNIMDYCTKWEGKVIKHSPAEECRWKAHDTAIVSVEYIVHEAGDFILTASTDKTARLWSPQGHFVGTFGQTDPWNLKIPETWAHPKTPWTLADEDDITIAAEENIKTEVNQINKEEKEDFSLELGDTDETDSEKKTGLTTREGTTVTGEDSDNSLASIRNNKVDVTPNAEVPPCMTSLPTFSSLLDFPLKFKLKQRALTCAEGFNDKPKFERSKTFLGVKVENDLLRRQKDRKGRRHQYGAVTTESTTRFGKQCSPFHALSPPDWSEVELPPSLPLSSRMLNRGYTGENLTSESITAMDFSYAMPETPSQSRRPTSQANDTSIPASASSNVSRLPPIKSASGRPKSQVTISIEPPAS